MKQRYLVMQPVWIYLTVLPGLVMILVGFLLSTYAYLQAHQKIIGCLGVLFAIGFAIDFLWPKAIIIGDRLKVGLFGKWKSNARVVSVTRATLLVESSDDPESAPVMFRGWIIRI
jgi:hypothetical protein